MRDNVS